MIIGAATGYGWKQIQVWARSARAVGFEGRIVLVNYARSQDYSSKLQEFASPYDVQIVHRPLDRSFVNGRVVCQERFKDYASPWLWDLLRPDVRYVIATDVRDVVFQRNPSAWLTDHPFIELLGPGEGVRIEEEPWNAHETKLNFPYAYDTLKHEEVLNAGTFATLGYSNLQRLAATVYPMCAHGYLGADQPAFNYALRLTPLARQLNTVSAGAGWAAQMAVWAKLDLAKSLRLQGYMEPQQVEGGYVLTPKGELYTMVHQYDRFPMLNADIEHRYPFGA